MPVEEQVASLYAAVTGHLDDIPVEAVRAFERGFLKHLRERHPQVLAELRREKKLTESVRAGLEQALAEFKKTFRA
jgi:F-type H+-transporting ATPase subunit alpha